MRGKFIWLVVLVGSFLPAIVFAQEACSGTGVAACAFLFKDVYGNRLCVTTEGEEVTREKSYARVSGFQFVCE